MTAHDLKAFVRYKQQSDLKPQSVVSMWKMVAAFYLNEEIVKKVAIPKVPNQVINGFSNDEVGKMINDYT